ncbi:uncharacterized protein LOC111623251 isoform X2 [Centruroides sculpturatus]|uniref:uncharacterized protein LOC111623251 isoform X2 n=1 Tax=Centruroides sculpturatus TaxID=218467 RepID=UPI000C6D3CD1|nr:uncharacterized protein LOC111623251 isoform X2 [Centruroides sculpturatus]
MEFCHQKENKCRRFKDLLRNWFGQGFKERANVVNTKKTKSTFIKYMKKIFNRKTERTLKNCVESEMITVPVEPGYNEDRIMDNSNKIGDHETLEARDIDELDDESVTSIPGSELSLTSIVTVIEVTRKNFDHNNVNLEEREEVQNISDLPV